MSWKRVFGDLNAKGYVMCGTVRACFNS